MSVHPPHPTPSVPFPSISPPLSFLHSYYLLCVKSDTMSWGYRGSPPATTWVSLEVDPPPVKPWDDCKLLRDPEPEPSSYAASKFLTHKNCDCNCRLSSNCLYPVSNKILSCFSETQTKTTSQAAEACSEDIILTSSCTQNQSLPFSHLPEQKDWDMTRTWTPEPFQKQRVGCPRRIWCWSPLPYLTINGQVPKLSNQKLDHWYFQTGLFPSNPQSLPLKALD